MRYITLIPLILLAGCSRPIGSISPAVRASSSLVIEVQIAIEAGSPMTDQQLRAGAGPPDIIVSPRELRLALALEYRSFPRADQEVSNIRRRLIRSRVLPDDAARWEESPAFGNCTLWLYRWLEPVPAVTPCFMLRRPAVGKCDYFVLNEQRVIGTGALIIPLRSVTTPGSRNTATQASTLGSNPASGGMQVKGRRKIVA
jgi:hypothetical protein